MHTEAGAQRQKLEEERIATMLAANNIAFRREHRVDFHCWGESFAKVDFVVDKPGGVLLLEVDELQHQHYGVVCDVARMSKLHAALALGGNTLPVGIIRYNPHTFQKDSHVQQISKRDREQALLHTLQHWEYGAAGSLELQYMYYDACSLGDREIELLIWNNKSFPAVMRACCRCPIV